MSAARNSCCWVFNLPFRASRPSTDRSGRRVSRFACSAGPDAAQCTHGAGLHEPGSCLHRSAGHPLHAVRERLHQQAGNAGGARTAPLLPCRAACCSEPGTPAESPGDREREQLQHHCLLCTLSVGSRTSITCTATPTRASILQVAASCAGYAGNSQPLPLWLLAVCRRRGPPSRGALASPAWSVPSSCAR